MSRILLKAPKLKKRVRNWQDTGKEIDETENPLKLSILKPLHATSFIQMYNHMTEEDEGKVCMKGCEVTEIKEALQKRLAGWPNLEPFKYIDPITESDTDLTSQAASINNIQESSKYVSSESVYIDSKSNDEWFKENKDNDNQTRNVFDCFGDENGKGYIVILARLQHEDFFFLHEKIRLADIFLISIFVFLWFT